MYKTSIGERCMNLKKYKAIHILSYKCPICGNQLGFNIVVWECKNGHKFELYFKETKMEVN